MIVETTVCFGHDHPALPGHFPGDPLIPGVVILDQVEQALSAKQEGRLLQLPMVKFVSPLRAGEPFTIRIEAVRPNGYRFVCKSGERVIAQGQLVWEA